MTTTSQRETFRTSRLLEFCSQKELVSSRPEDSHLRALPDPYVNLSIHTAPDVRPFPWQSCQWAKSVGFARRSRSNQSRAPLVFRRSRLNLRRADCPHGTRIRGNVARVSRVHSCINRAPLTRSAGRLAQRSEPWLRGRVWSAR